jgi:hypothetical protein
MLVENHKGTFYCPYTLLGATKKVYYETPNERMPHQGKRERERRMLRLNNKKGLSLRQMLALNR